MILLLDATENVIISGTTRSIDFPTTPGAYDETWNGGYWDIFVTKLDATCSNLIFSTYLGGSSWEGAFCNAMCLDTNGVIAIGGCTGSYDFPTTPNAFDTTYNGGPQDGILAILNSTGSQLLYSTFIGGPDTFDVVVTMRYDLEGNIAFAGQADSGFPTTPGAYDTILAGRADAFVARLSPDSNGKSDLVYSSYIGGSEDEAVTDLDVADDSTAMLVGFTYSSDFPTTPSAYDPTYNGVYDGFILRFGPQVGVEELTKTKPHSSVTLSPVFPNPARGRVSCEVSLARSAKVKVSLFDITGRYVETVMDKPLSAGVHDLTWTPRHDLANGIYYLRLDADGEQQSRKFIMMK